MVFFLRPVGHSFAASARAALTNIAARRSIARSWSAAPANAARSSISPSASTTATRAFAASAVTRGHGKVDDDLAKLLGKEIAYEAEEQPKQGEENALEEFIKKAEWKIDAKLGNDEITMTKDFGNEKIRVVFAISDVNNTDETEQFEGEEEENQASQEEEGNEVTFPIRSIITVEKADKGALNFEVEMQDGEILINQVAHYSSSSLAHGSDNDSDWQRRGLYAGPVFDQLETELQSSFQEYLEERGIDTAFAVFVAEFVEHREQKEYVNWLKTLKDFVKA